MIKLLKVADNPKVSTHALAAKNIRIELKAAFPKTKFSVRSKSFSMGDSIDISWVDGPTDEEVDNIVNKYEYGRFDPMQDLQYSEHSEFMEQHGESKYIMTSREYSPSFVQRAIDYIWHKYKVSANKITPDDFFNGSSWNIPIFDNNNFNRESCAQSMIHETLHKVSRVNVQ